jgi:hypothetical protein
MEAGVEVASTGPDHSNICSNTFTVHPPSDNASTFRTEPGETWDSH